ncbi:hypothetical protein AB0B25_16370 [Nocardia sp. NPDC049190]|uniref:terpene synthase family protein n=1 Tax=Nocardia sp. NPDC049190 TaxID=3155650 RepID=UPI0033F23175
MDQLLNRLGQFMPIESVQDVPAATSPTEHRLLDLWSRTAPVMSHGWRRKTRERVEQCLSGNLQERRNLVHGHTSNPIEYLELKRITNGAPVVACLVEYARATELPAAVAADPVMRSLVDTINDARILVNDIHSYQREMASEDEPANMIFVLRKFLGCDLDQAVAMTSDLARSRLDQFEHLADVEVPAMIQECGLSPAESANVLGYIEDLRDWVPGWQEWFARTERYPQNPPVMTVHGEPADIRRLGGHTGLGTATARRLLLSP